MNLSLSKSIRRLQSAAYRYPPPDLASKADICAKVIAEAHKLAQAGRYDTLPDQLAARAGELLDDMDEILVALDPKSNGPSFAIAATLHRELELVQMRITKMRRGEASPPNGRNRR